MGEQQREPTLSNSKNSVRNRLEEHLTYFVQLLRNQGIKAGTAELEDALQALQLVDPGDEKAFKIALQGTLIKKPAEKEIFDRTFRSYFIAQKEREEKLEWGQKQEQWYQEQQEQAERELTFQGEELELTEEEKAVYASLSSGDQQKLKDFVKETEQGKKVDSSFKPVMENLVKSSLRYWKRQASRYPQPPQEITGDPAWDWVLSSAEGGEGAGSSGSLAHIDFKDLPPEEIPRAVELARKMSLRLAKSISRRYRQSKKVKKLDLRRTMRESVNYGGYLVKLRYGHHRRRKPRLLVIGDVSGSMDRYSGLVMTFLYGLTWAIKEVECFVFAEGVSRVTPYFKKGLSFEEVMGEIGDKSAKWGKGTRLYYALEKMASEHSSVLTPRTVVVVVSDTKTTSLDRSVRALEGINSKVKEVLWLNPLPLEDWEEHRSVREFRETATMLPCRSLYDLEKIFLWSMV